MLGWADMFLLRLSVAPVNVGGKFMNQPRELSVHPLPSRIF